MNDPLNDTEPRPELGQDCPHNGDPKVIDHRDTPWRCRECGSPYIEESVWREMNSGEIMDGEPLDVLWCPDCEEDQKRADMVCDECAEVLWPGPRTWKARRHEAYPPRWYGPDRTIPADAERGC